MCQALCVRGQGQVGGSAFLVSLLLHGASMLTSPRNEDLLCSPIVTERGFFSLTLSVGDRPRDGTQQGHVEALAAHGLAPGPVTSWASLPSMSGAPPTRTRRHPLVNTQRSLLCPSGLLVTQAINVHWPGGVWTKSLGDPASFAVLQSPLLTHPGVGRCHEIPFTSSMPSLSPSPSVGGTTSEALARATGANGHR